MLAGHFTTAIIAHQRFPKGSLLFFLVASQLQDLLWFVFHFLGLETTTPHDVFDATLETMSVDMLYSHDLIPLGLWVIVIGLAGKMLYKSTEVGLVASALVLGHFVLDFFSGHPHHVFGQETMNAGLGLYQSNVYWALGIEIVFCAVALGYFFKEHARRGTLAKARTKLKIVGLHVFAIAYMLSIATTSFRDLLGIPSFDIGLNTTVPTIVLTYIAMMLFLNAAASECESISTQY